jgi:hypothetical protein
VYAVVLPAETSQVELDLFATVLKSFTQVEGQVISPFASLVQGAGVSILFAFLG